MHFGIRLYGIAPDVLVEKARAAENLGFESAWRGDHLFLPTEITTPYPYQPNAPFDSSAPILDPLVLFGYVAAATTTLRMAVGVFVLGLRDPRVVARAVQTLDVLSSGRITFGVGAGWLREEFEAMERPFEGRGRLTDESIEVLRRLWTEEAPSFEGEYLRFPPVRFEPKPVQRPHPPIVIGGESKAALRRAARLGDGWYGHAPNPDEVRGTVEHLRALREEVGREDDPFEVTVRILPTVSPDDVAAFAEAGVDRLVLQVGDFSDVDGRGELPVWEEFSRRVISAVPTGG